MARTISDEELQLKKRARRRLIGAIVLVAAIVVALPMVLDTEPKPGTDAVDIKIPSTDSGAFTSRVVPVTPPVEPKAGAKAAPEARAPAKTAPEAKKPAPEAKPSAQAPAVPPPAPAAAPKTAPAPASQAAPAPAAQVAPPRKSEAKSAQGPPFVVQVVALADAAKAKQLQVQIAAAGIKSYTEVVKTAKGDVTRVRAGPYNTRTQAEKVSDQLKAMGLSGNVIPK